MNGYFSSYTLPNIGRVWVAKTSKGICRIEINKDKNQFLKCLPAHISWQEGRPQNHRSIPKAPLDFSSGTPFQQKVWRQIIKIPKGETRSYAWLAKMAGRPKAVRAAANACGANPIPVLIPCHRVIRSDGTIGGFSGPLSLKKHLLKLEGIRF